VSSRPVQPGLSASVNGKPRSVPSGSTVADLLAELELRPMQVVVEHNGRALERERFARTVVSEGDRIEIAQMVGGG